MPFGSYQASKEMAVTNAIKFIKNGCDAVKLEGGIELVDTIRTLVSYGIPVMGHLGLKPQTSLFWNRSRVHARTKASAVELITEAKALERAGVFSLVLEMVTSEVADIISRNISSAVIGIGSGPRCDGQVLVLHDMLGLYEDIKPKFVKRYARLSENIFRAITRYINDVKNVNFPEDKNTIHMSSDEYSKLRENGSVPK
jgi:3-methyl-2-oxobutanoate hydroxymethyltransferase